MKQIHDDYSIFAAKALAESDVVIKSFPWERSAELASCHIVDVFKRKVEFVCFTKNEKGIEYKNTSNEPVKVCVKIYVDGNLAFEDKLVLAPNTQYFSALNDAVKVNNSIVFKVYDEFAGLIFEKESKPQNKERLLHHTVSYFNSKFKLPNLEFYYNNETNTLRFRSKGGNSDSCVFVARDLYRGLLLSSINNRDPFFIKEGWDYFVYASKDHVLSSDLFTGFMFVGYTDGAPQFLITVPTVEGCSLLAKHGFSFSDESCLELHDNFFAQSIDFYTKDFYKMAVLRGDTVVDIGASCGTFVDFCLSRGAAKVYAVEPSASFKVLNATFKNEPSVNLWCGVIDNKDGSSILTTCSDTTLSSFDMGAQIAADYNKNIKNISTISVNTKTLQSYFRDNNIEKIDVLKMDIEGHEYSIFDSLDITIFANISSIILEYHHNKDGILDKIITSKLRRAGYKIVRYDLSLKQNDDLTLEKGVLYATKRVHISNESPALGDCIAWISEVERYREINNAEVCYYTPKKDLFESTYPNIRFFDYNEKPPIVDKMIGCYDINGEKWNTFGLQELACKILGIPSKLISQPKVSLPENLKNRFDKKYICIAVQSTCQAKYWNNTDGWQKVVNYLKSLGYEVLCVDKEQDYGVEGYMNSTPRGCHK